MRTFALGALFAVGSIFAASDASAAEPTRAPVCDVSRWESFIGEAADRFCLPPAWIRAVMHIESAGCLTFQDRPIISAAGAMGLMQLMPTVWEEYRRTLHLGTDPQNPHDNILTGAAYLRSLCSRFGAPACFAAYHAGPARLEAFLERGAPMPTATLEYLERVLREAGFDTDPIVGRFCRMLFIRDQRTSDSVAALDDDPSKLMAHSTSRSRAEGAQCTGPSPSLFAPISRESADMTKVGHF